MSVKYGKFEMPQKITVDKESESKTYARFIAEPFERGFGHTIGNSMRRMMLSSLEAPAIISMRIEGAPHEYMSIEGVIEDMTNIILNFKGALFRCAPSEQVHVAGGPRHVSTSFEVTREDLDKNGGQVSILLGDLVKEGNFEVVNPDLHFLR